MIFLKNTWDRAVCTAFSEIWVSSNKDKYRDWGCSWDLLDRSEKYNSSGFVLPLPLFTSLLIFTVTVVEKLLFFKATIEVEGNGENDQVKTQQSSLLSLRFSHFPWVSTLWISVSLWIAPGFWKSWFWQFSHCYNCFCGRMNFQRSTIYLYF